MRKDFGAKPLTYPQPVFIVAAYDEYGNANAMNVAWGGIRDANAIAMCISATHKTVKNILISKAFTVSIGDADHVVACDYLGIATGNQEPDKLEKAGFNVTRSEHVNAPIIDELPICLECRMLSYDEDISLMVGEIVNISVDESVLTDGKVDIKKVQPITYDPFNKTYHVIGEKVGDAWESGKEMA